MKKKKFMGIAALLPFVLCDLTTPVYARNTEYQILDTTKEESSAECEVIYKSTYEFSEDIPKYPEMDVTASGYEGVYDGKPHGITVSCKTGGVTILYSTDGKTYTKKKPAYTDVGIYVVYYKVEKDGYATTTGSAIVKLKEALIDFISSDYSGVYDGKGHSIDLTVKTDVCKILYSEDGINYTSKKPEYKEPGTYVVYYKILKDNYTTEAGSNRVIIKEKDLNIKLSDTSGTVKVNNSIKFTVDTGGEPFNITISDPTIVKATVKDGKVTATGLKAGTATITIISKGKSVTYNLTVLDTSSSNSNNVVKNDIVSNVQTGDANSPLLYSIVLIASVFGLIKSKRRKEKRKL